MKNHPPIHQIATCMLVSIALALSACTRNASTSEIVLVPRPFSSETSSGAFRFDEKTTLAVPDEETQGIAENFAALFTRTAGFTPTVQIGQKGDIVFHKDTTMKAEAYKLKIRPDRVTISAADTRGYFYALQSLRLMLPKATCQPMTLGTYLPLPSQTNHASATVAICWMWPATFFPKKKYCV